MNQGMRQGLLIATAAVLAIALLVALPPGWYVVGSWIAQDRVRTEMTSLCESVPIGADTSTLLRRASESGITLSHEPGGATYTHRRLMAGYNETSCEFKVDGAGTVVARNYHPVGPIHMRRAERAASAASLSG